MVICNNRIFALVWRILGFLIALFGLFFVLRFSAITPYVWVYYSFQTNTIALMFFWLLWILTLIQLLEDGAKGPAPSVKPVLHVGVVFILMAMFFIYLAFLPWVDLGLCWQSDLGQASGNFIMHIITPLWMLADFILFVPHGNLNFKTAFWWLTYPVAYTLFLIANALLFGIVVGISRFPYFFADIDKLGWLCLPIALAFYVFFLLVGLLIIYLDKLLARHQQSRKY